mgnify:CR=1 FL=1
MKIQKGLIVSCQAEEGSLFNTPESIVNFAVEAEKGGAVGVRIRDVENVYQVSKKVSIPIMGLSKSTYKDGTVWITPSYLTAKDLSDVGADFIAMDATGREGYYDIVKASNNNNMKIIGDISHISQAEKAIKSGCVGLTTALSGYTLECDVNMEEPDFDLLQELISHFPKIPIMAEGRYWEREQVKRAFDMGANNVVIGSAITRPYLITKRFQQTLKTNK